jgi:colanic acid/amylovoran biosynthesis protein
VLLLLSTNTFFIKWFLTDCEIEGINEILDSDIIISKGGSYLTAQNKSLRQTLSLATMLYPFVFASRYKKKIVIFSQSLGPVVGKFNKFIFKKSLENVDAIHLRESLCIRKYSEVRAVCENNKAVSVVPDTAFALKHDETDIPLPININKRFFNVGYTLVDHPFIYLNSVTEIQKKRENYKKCIVDSIIYLIENKNAIIHIFPQVLVGDSRLGSSDVQLSKYIVQLFSNGIYSDRVKFYDDNFTPIELRQMYSQMDIFIGTRLHSVIFALSMCVPSINISYHGTKSQGILENLGNFDKYVIDINHLVSEDFINMIDEMCHNRKDISFKLSKSIKIARNDLNNAMQKVIKQQFTKH